MKKYKSKILLLIILSLFLFGTNVKAMDWEEFKTHLCLAHGQPFRTHTGLTSDGDPPARYAKGSGSFTYTDEVWNSYDHKDDDGNWVGDWKTVTKKGNFSSSDMQVDGIPVVNNYSSGGNGKINVGFGSSTNDLTVGYMLNQGGGYYSSLQTWVWSHMGMIQSAMHSRSP